MTRSRPFRIFDLVRDRRGSALVEFTLLAPFLLFLGLGMAEFGRFLYQYQLVVEGLRDGARYLARVQDPTTVANKTSAANLAVTGTIDGSGSARVEGWVAADVTFAITDIDNSAGTYRGDATIEVVHAATTFDYADVGFLSALSLPSISVDATQEQRAIRD
jgi:Flp pilus assembly protein TadG